MKDALLIELAATWELQAETGGDGLNNLQPPARETLRACADTLRMLVDVARLLPETAGDERRHVICLCPDCVAPRPAQSDALRDVLAERQRQVSVEGWTLEHDDDHNPGELACAGAAYVLAAGDVLHPFSQGDAGFDSENPPDFWPTDWGFKPADPRRMLVKGVALGLAELERFDRAAGKGVAP